MIITGKQYIDIAIQNMQNFKYEWAKFIIRKIVVKDYEELKKLVIYSNISDIYVDGNPLPYRIW